MSDRPQKMVIASSVYPDQSNQILNSDRPIIYDQEKVLQWFDIFHPWDCILADATEGKPNWITHKYPLNPKTLFNRWLDEKQLIGVRFSTRKENTAWYAMLDIDIGSQYYPNKSTSACWQVISALERIGLYGFLIIRSSHSRGLHIYFPLPKAVSCYKLSLLLQQTLAQTGLCIRNGQLEAFPNQRSASKTLYQAHRLPLQIGSFVLDENFHPVHNSLEQFIDQWRTVSAHQDIEQLEKSLASLNSYRSVGNRVDVTEWEERLQDSLETGWTTNGQTNNIIKEACIYARVFKRMEWSVVEDWAIQTLPQLPGYHRYCRHQHEVDKLIKDWVTCNRKNNRYHPYGSKSKQPKESRQNLNAKRKQGALQRIQDAIASILDESDTLPSTVRERQKQICSKAKCSASTLRKYKELWHPDFIDERCVTPQYERVSANSVSEILTIEPEQEIHWHNENTQNSYSERVLEDLSQDSLTHEIDEPRGNDHQRCVTPELKSISANSDSFGGKTAIAQLAINQAVTRNALLSVKGSVDEQGNVHPKVTALDTSDKYSKVQINTVVQRKSDRSYFRVTRLNLNGTVWAKWLNQYVALTEVILRLSDIEVCPMSNQPGGGS